MNFDDELCRSVAESADRLISAQVFMSGGAAELTSRNITKDLYEAARRDQGDPLTYLAARRLFEAVSPRRSVIFCTGFFDPPSMIDEADGPLGSALLARALCAMLDATPVFVVEVANMRRMADLISAAGMEVLDYPMACTTPFKAALYPLPIDAGRAEAEARRCLDETDPCAFIAIEKPSPCPRGRYHTGVGLDVTDLVGKVSFIVEAARSRGVPTIGFGDGGNEVGMGRILPAILEIVPTGKLIGTSLATEILVVSAVANWGAYAVEACLAAALHMPEAIHALADERRVTEAAARAGFIDPVTGLANGWVDGTPPVCSESILELLRQMVELRLLKKRRGSLQNFPRRWAERESADAIVRLWGDRLAKLEADYFASRGK